MGTKAKVAVTAYTSRMMLGASERRESRGSPESNPCPYLFPRWVTLDMQPHVSLP